MELIIVFIFAFIVLFVVGVIWTILDIFQRDLRLTEKILWTILIIITPIIGSFIYFILGRKAKLSV